MDLGRWSDGERVVRGQPDGLVTFGAAGACNQLHAVELATGKPRWTARWEPSSSDRFGAVLRPEVSSGVAVVPDSRAGGFTGYDLATGAPRWAYELSTDNPVAAPTGQPGSCVATGLAAGVRSVLLLTDCSPQAFVLGDGRAVVRALDPVTGVPRWSVPLPPEAAPITPGVVLDALTAEPPTVSVGNLDGGGALLVLDEATGAIRTAVRLGGRIAVDDGAIRADTAPHVLVDGSTVFLRTVADSPERVVFGGGLALVAVDVAAGEVAWSSGRDRPACFRGLAGISGGALLVVEDVDPEGPIRLFRYRIDGGARTGVANLDGQRDARPFNGVARISGAGLVVLPGDARDSEHAALGFGPLPR